MQCRCFRGTFPCIYDSVMLSKKIPSMTDAHWLLARLNKRKTHDAMLSDGNSGDVQPHRGGLRGTQSETLKVWWSYLSMLGEVIKRREEDRLISERRPVIAPRGFRGPMTLRKLVTGGSAVPVRVQRSYISDSV